MSAVYKYPLAEFPAPTTDIHAPRGTRWLRVGRDGTGQLCVWALVDNREFDYKWTLATYATGEEMPEKYEDDCSYVGSYEIPGAFWMIFHVFDVTE